jgi:hypothetical protein
VLVERFAAPSESDVEIFLDDQGMLAVPSFARHGDGGLSAIRTLAAEESFSLLGEPGAGKTTALESIISGIPELDAAEPGQDAVLVVPLGEIADRAAFHDLVTGPVLARVPAGQGEPEGRLTLMLDGLDECPLPGGARVFAGLLREALADLQLQPRGPQGRLPGSRLARRERPWRLDLAQPAARVLHHRPVRLETRRHRRVPHGRPRQLSHHLGHVRRCHSRSSIAPAVPPNSHPDCNEGRACSRNSVVHLVLPSGSVSRTMPLAAMSDGARNHGIKALFGA